jgi:excisionase family DNA binding protein
MSRPSGETATNNIVGVGKLLYTRREAAFALGLSVRSVDYLVAKKELSVRRIGGRVLIPSSEVHRFARSDHHEGLRPVA